MEEFKDAIFGHHGIDVWFATLAWTLAILIVFKLSKAPKIKKGFKIWYFINDNLFDMIFNVFLASLMLRAGNPLIHLVYKLVNDKFVKPLFDYEFSVEGMDVVIMVSIIVLPLSLLIHKFFRKPVSDKLEKEMQVHNNSCTH